MKRCPKCNRTYANDAQKFCTIDGDRLVDAPAQSANLGETIRIDSAQLNSSPVDTENEVTKVISGKLPQDTGGFDPYRTVLAGQPSSQPAASRDTQNLTPPAGQLTPSGDLPASSSGPIPPPSTPASPPPPPTPSSGPIPPLPVAPQQSTSQPLPAPAQQAAPPRPAKKSKLPLVLGILAVLFVLGIGVAAAGYWFVVRPMLAKRALTIEPQREPEVPTATPANEPTTSEAAPSPVVTNEAPAYSPPADAVQFVNSKDNLDGKLLEHYVDFSFYYPESWQKDPKAGVPGASNFAKVERRLPPDFTQENFAVGWYSSAGSEEGDRAVFHTLAENLSRQFEKNFAEYRKVSEGPTKAGPYDGYEFRFESVSRNTDKGDINIWGRVIFVPPVNGGKDGVTLLMLATSLARELKSVNDVGVKGDLPMMLQSFRFGK